MIPEAAIEAAAKAMFPGNVGPAYNLARAALEAAAPHMLAAVAECSTCHGFGTIGDGPFTVGAECHDCGGKGAGLRSQPIPDR